MLKSKIQPYYFYATLFMIAIFSTLAHLHITFSIFLYGLVIVAPILFDDTKTISVYFFSACFMGCFGSSGFLIALNVSLFILEIKKLIEAIRSKTNKKEIVTILTTWLLLLVILTLYSLIYNNFKVYRMAMFLDFIQCILACYLVRKTIDIKHILFTLLSGIVVSFGISTCFSLSGTENKYIEGWLGYRFGGFFNNINTLAVYCTLCTSSFIVLLLTEKLNFKCHFFYPFISTLIGLSTMSIAFILMSLLLYGSWFALSFVKSKNKKRFGLYLILIALGGIAFAFIAREYILTILNRFLNTGHSSTLNNLTTGRVDIWKKYLSRWIDSPLTILFGNGYTAPKIDTNQYEHSIYIAFLFQFGIVGTIAIIGTLVWTLRQGAKLQRNIAYYIPLGIFLFNGLVSNLSGVLCSCLIWFVSFYFVATDTISNVQINQNNNKKEKQNNCAENNTDSTIQE